MTKCYFCGGWIESQHRTDVQVTPDGIRRAAHKQCAKESKQRHERQGYPKENPRGV